MEKPESSSIKARLASLKKNVQKATQEAFHQATLGDTTTPVVENDDPNASFHLGMQLFGNDPSVIEHNIQSRLSEMEEELEDVMSEIQSKPSSLDAQQQQQQRPLTTQEMKQEEQVLRTKIEFLRHCSQIRALLDESLTLSTAALSPTAVDRVQAAQKLVQAQDVWDRTHKILQASQGAPTAALAAAEQILQSLRRSLRIQKVDLLDKAKAMWKACVSLPSSHSIQVKGNQALDEAYQVMEVFAEHQKQGHHILHDVLRKFTKQVYDEALKEAIVVDAEKGSLAMTPVAFQETEERSSLSSVIVSSANKGSWKSLDWERRDDETTELTALKAWKESLAFLQRILVFVADNILLGRPSLCEIVGKRLLGDPSAMPASLRLEELGLGSCRIGDDFGLLMEPLVKAFVETSLPSFIKPTEIQGLEDKQKELEAIVAPFLSVMVEKGLMPSTECSLEKFAKSYIQQYVNNRRCQKLNEIRGLLLKSDYHNTVLVGEAHNENNGLLGVKDGMSVFKLQRAAVSEPAQRLIAICRRCMDEAVEQAASKQNPDSPLSLLPATLYKTARECLDLYRAIIPVQYSTEIEQVPRTAAVFHNDCVYFAYHCQILGIEYKARFPPPSPKDIRGQVLHQTFIFVDMVPALRTLAENAMRKMLDRQAKQIQELVGERTILLGKALRSDEILAEWSEAEAAVNAGLYHIRHLSQAWKPVLSYEVFHRCICFLADVMFSLLLDQVGKATDISTMACQFVNNLFQRAQDGVADHLDGDFSSSQVHDRFTTIGKCMDMTLNDIKIGLSKGVFRSVTGQELSRLINATFDDSPKRRDLLRLLTAHHVKA
eukprot:scaffold34921_cov162-Amphora_coffeaeformis.AAC.18